jgi:hypothetical protein
MEKKPLIVVVKDKFLTNDDKEGSTLSSLVALAALNQQYIE